MGVGDSIGVEMDIEDDEEDMTSSVEVLIDDRDC